MARFFFHLADGVSTPDQEGFELPDLEASRGAALHLLAQSLIDRPGDFWARREWLLTVADEAGLTLYTVQVFASDAPSVQIAPPNPIPSP